jgi:hypothetical protein
MTDRALIYVMAAANAVLAYYWTSSACDCASQDRPILRKLIALLWMFLGLV